MTKRHTDSIKRWLGAALFALAAAMTAAHAAGLPGPLVTPPWLHDHAKEVQIVDIRDNLDSLTSDPKFRIEKGQKVLERVGGHIPDALSVNFWGLRDKHVIDGKTIDFMPPTAKEFE